MINKNTSSKIYDINEEATTICCAGPGCFAIFKVCKQPATFVSHLLLKVEQNYVQIKSALLLCMLVHVFLFYFIN